MGEVLGSPWPLAGSRDRYMARGSRPLISVCATRHSVYRTSGVDHHCLHALPSSRSQHISQRIFQLSRLRCWPRAVDHGTSRVLYSIASDCFWRRKDIRVACTVVMEQWSIYDMNWLPTLSSRQTHEFSSGPLRSSYVLTTCWLGRAR